MLRFNPRKSRLCKLKTCRARFIPAEPWEWWCCVEHMREIAVQKREAAQRKETRERLKALEPLPKVKARMKRKAQLLARLRDKDEGCISCGTMTSDEYHGGHFYPAEKHPLIRFDWRRNIHKQCQQCNTRLRGNLAPYSGNLAAKIGAEEFAALRELAKTTSHRHTRQELAEIEAGLDADLKELRETR